MAILALTSPETQQRRITTLRWFFEGSEGYIRLAIIDRRSDDGPKFEEYYFHWPRQADELFEQTQAWAPGYDCYFSPMVFSKPIGRKENVIETPFVYSDLDACDPSNLRVAPQLTVQTSTGRWQGYWKLDRRDYAPAEVEEMSRRIAYSHVDEGADKNGWDLTQLLRLPFTLNHKYIPAQFIKIEDATGGVVTLAELDEAYPLAGVVDPSGNNPPVPTDIANAETILLSYGRRIHHGIHRMLEETPPDHGWSETLWKLMLDLFEVGLTREEAFAVCRESNCNKFARDGRSDRYLWADICRGWKRFVSTHKPMTATLSDVDLLTAAEREAAVADRTFVEEYIEWASSLGDAAVQYHEAGAFVVLSSLLAGNVRLPTSYGVLLPNLWFMILADTTLTRKTTAMDIAMDLVVDVDHDAILATDGSIEGLMTGMSTRPGRPSVFLRDEFSGLIESMTKKDYYAGMAEAFTKLYDGKYQKRMLRREVIEVREPVLIMFAGGIRNRILSMLSWEHVASGFLPRFVFITAVSDPSKMRPLGPPTDRTMGQRDYILTKLRAMHAHYTNVQQVTTGGKTVIAQTRYDASLTEEAWERYREIEALMLQAGVDSNQPDLTTPTMDRLCKSGLKVATLLAASRNLGSSVTITLQDVIKAFWYIEKWREYTSDVLDNIGHTDEEKEMSRVFDYVTNHPGCLRSEVMQRFVLTARRAEAIFETLAQRDKIVRQKTGRAERLHPFLYQLEKETNGVPQVRLKKKDKVNDN